MEQPLIATYKGGHPLLTLLRRGDTCAPPFVTLSTDSDPSGSTATAELFRLGIYEVEAPALTATPVADNSTLTVSLDPALLAASRPGLYALRFTVTFPDGTIGTFPPDSSMVLNLT